ncbi:Putative protein [Zobellia galactanivorans]|uniref:Uncharacterized protein n=1 Tax=Zobellia galactanivorans (strain DSM 12802 / CCUG 47099 / CIP 106680 / NCIMB 13871 / Dsij) TaxID=63186 RepID=G0L2M5_ZOBGA|nr:Putative protein [Zobellia galactanivorans]
MYGTVFVDILAYRKTVRYLGNLLGGGGTILRFPNIHLLSHYRYENALVIVIIKRACPSLLDRPFFRPMFLVMGIYLNHSLRIDFTTS